jgi:hypothetical protein
MRGLPATLPGLATGLGPAVMSGGSNSEVRPLPADLLERYRCLLLAHANDPAFGACPLCRRTRCYDWLWAYQQLVSAGEMLTPDGQQQYPANAVPGSAP